MRLQWKVFWAVVAMTTIAILSVNGVLVVSLETNDRKEAEEVALSLGKFIRNGVLSVMVESGDYSKVTAVLNSMRKESSLNFRIIRNQHLFKQFGEDSNKRPSNNEELKVLKTGEPATFQDGESAIRVILPFITDARCGKCHRDLNGNPVGAGVVNGALILTFDYAQLAVDSSLLTLQIMTLLTTILVAGAFITLYYTRAALTKPLEKIAEAITSIRQQNFDVTLRDYTTREIGIISDEIVATGKELKLAKELNEKKLVEQRQIRDSLFSIVRDRAVKFGFPETEDMDDLLNHFTTVLDKDERSQLANEAREFVVARNDVISIPPKPHLIQAVAVFVSDSISGAIKGTNANSIEMVLDEALANAVFHGSLGIDSSLKDENFSLFTETANERSTKPPYNEMRIQVKIDFHMDRATVSIKDEGAGFDWRNWQKGRSVNNERLHGRGILIMRTLASDISFNDTGSEMIITFDGNSGNESS